MANAILAALLGGGLPKVDSIVLGTDLMPGQWLLEPNTQKEYGWQQVKGWGLSGAALIPVGDDLVEARFLARFWTDSDWDAFQPLRQKYLTRQVLQLGLAGNYAIGIIHPELNKLGVDAVVPKKVPAFTNNGKGLWSGIVEFIQYRKARAALESPKAALPAWGAPNPSSADNAARVGAAHTAAFAGKR